MSRIPRDIVDAVRDRVDIVEVVSRHVTLSRKGGRYVGLCPFHKEKSPSFSVVPAKGIFYCFGCQKGGDVFRFLMEVEGLSFAEAVKELAGPAGIVVEERRLSHEERARMRERATLYDVLEVAAGWFEAQLWTGDEGAVARRYLSGRGLTDETLKRYRLGWAPSGWTRLTDHLHHQGFSQDLVTQAGLARPRRGGDGHYDTFRERVIIPIRDERSRVIAFGGRILEGEGPKYINSPETPLYEKSKTLYGLDQARVAIGQQDRTLVVEGYFDVISLHQAGFQEAIATCGTALTAEHLAKIGRHTRNVVVLLDADEAGSRAAERALPLFVEAGLKPWRLQLPGAKDPDELVREQGAEAMEAAMNLKEPLVEWVVQRQQEALGYDAERVVEALLDILVQLPPAQVSRIAARLKYPEEILWKRLERHVPRARNEEATPAPPTWTPHADVTHLLWLLVHRHARVADLMMRVHPGFLHDHPQVRDAVVRLVQGEPVAAILDDTEDDGLRRALLAVVARHTLYEEDDAPQGLVETLYRLLRPQWARERARLEAQADQARQRGDWTTWGEHARALKALSERVGEAEKARNRLVDRTSVAEARVQAANIEACLAFLEQSWQVGTDRETIR